MKIHPCFFASALFTPFLLFAEAKEIPVVPTTAEAEAIVATERQARETSQAERKAAIESVPAYEEWEVDHGNRKTILRRVAPPENLNIEDHESRQGGHSTASSKGPATTEEEITAWMDGQPFPRTLNLTAVVYDRTLTEITWRDEGHREWTILSNVDFRYLGGTGGFEDGTHQWLTFLFVDEVDSEKEAATARRAADEGFSYEPRTAERWRPLVPGDFLFGTEPEYLLVATEERREIPAALFEELDALHSYYHAHEERLIADYYRNKALNEARRAWREANPPEPRDSVINFWRVR